MKPRQIALQIKLLDKVANGSTRPQEATMATNTTPFITSRTALAGVLAGLAGFTAFLFIHQALIRPIWFIAPFGAVVAALAGLLVAWAYDALRPRLPRNI